MTGRFLPLAPSTERSEASSVKRRARAALLALAATAALIVAPPRSAQEAPVLRPGDPAIDASRIEPFAAEYEQLGRPFWVQAYRVEGERPVLGFLMTEGGPADAIGVHADTLGFAYRNFDFAAFGREHIDVRERDGTITMLRMSLEADGYPERRQIERALDAPVFDGTVAYWLLASLPLAEGYAARPATLRWTDDGFEEQIGAFEVIGSETVHAADGRSWDCWIVLTQGSRAQLRSWVAHEAPYLIRQTMHRDGETETVVELAGLAPR